jgi:type I restriction enzyme S subunit
MPEQQRIVARIEGVLEKVADARVTANQADKEREELLQSTFASITRDCNEMQMRDVAPLVRRPVELDASRSYPELGIRSFGKGTFHKPALLGVAVGSKRLYAIHPGDLVFNNVFAWEGAVAVAQPEDAGRVGSHRFITCVAKEGVVTADFLCFYFRTPRGLAALGVASPGGAGRNRTLNLELLERIAVPVPDYPRQLWFDELQRSGRQAERVRSELTKELDALVPSILDKAFRGEL